MLCICFSIQFVYTIKTFIILYLNSFPAHLISCGKALLCSAASKGSPVSWPTFMSSSAVKQGSVSCEGVSFSTSESTVAPPSSLLMRSSFSSTMKCTRAFKDTRSPSKVGCCEGSTTFWIKAPSICHSCACQLRQNLKSTFVTPGARL